MRILLPLCSFLFIASACSKDDNDQNPSFRLKGIYTGTFKRYNIAEDKTAAVSLNFTKAGWTGNSSLTTYPALGGGSYKMEDNNAALVFKNKTTWTANFDWTYILDGIYLLHKNGDSLVFTKSYGNGAVDVFKLVKEN